MSRSRSREPACPPLGSNRYELFAKRQRQARAGLGPLTMTQHREAWESQEHSGLPRSGGGWWRRKLGVSRFLTGPLHGLWPPFERSPCGAAAGDLSKRLRGNATAAQTLPSGLCSRKSSLGALRDGTASCSATAAKMWTARRLASGTSTATKSTQNSMSPEIK